MNLSEQPWTILIVGFILAAIVSLIGFQTGRNKLFLLGGLIFVVTLVLLWWERQVQSPREQVEATLYQIAAALEQNDVEKVVEFVSPGKPELRQEARRRMDMVTIGEVKIKNNLTIELADDRGANVANAEFNAVIQVSGKAGSPAEGILEDKPIPQFFTLNLRREEDGRWRVRSYKMQDPRAGL